METISVDDLLKQISARRVWATEMLFKPFSPRSSLNTQEKWSTFFSGYIQALEMMEEEIVCWHYDPNKEPELPFQGI